MAAETCCKVEDQERMRFNERDKQRDTARWLTLYQVAVIPTIMDKFFGTIQRFIIQLTFYLIFCVLLQPPSPHSMLLGGNKVKTVCRTEREPVYAQR